MHTHTKDESYAYPDPATRRRAIVLAVVGGLCVLAVGVLLHSVVRPWLDDYSRELEKLMKHDPPAAKRSLLNLIALILALNSGLALGLAIWTIRTGWQMTRAERWPRPGMKIYRRTKILDAKTARRQGKALIAVGLMLAILVPALGWRAYRASSALFDEPRRNNRQPTAPGAAAAPNR
jgi:hypothetical protein